MNQKIKAILLVSFSIVLFVAVAMFFMRGQFGEKKGDDIAKEYERIQNQFALDLPCGITDFDSPAVKPVQCAPEKMRKGEPIKMTLRGSVTDPDGKAIVQARLNINDSGDVYTDGKGNFSAEIEVDSIKKAINITGDKMGYSPIRKVLNAQVISEDGTQIHMPRERVENFVMREIDVQKAVLNTTTDTVITSDKYPGLSVTIPAGGIENALGEVVTGEVTGEITFLDPKTAEDVEYTPGFSGNTKQMVGVDHNGKQVLLDSYGLVMFHLKEKKSDAILQPRKGVTITITQPIPEWEYKTLTNPEAIAAAQISPEELAKEDAYHRELGVTENMSEDEKYETLLKNNRISVTYWYFNQRTGLWEEWPVRAFDVDVEKRIYTMQVPRLY